MKRLILSALLLLPLLTQADERSSAIIERLSTQFGSYKHYEVKFSARIDLAEGSVPGRYLVSGNRYYITANDRQIYSDGENKYEVNDADHEVTIDNINVNDKDILSNPTRAFEFVDGSFTHSYKGEMSYAGKKCKVIELLPTAKSSAIKMITLYVDSVSGLPRGVKYRIDGVNSEIEISVDRITQLPSVSDSLFVFSKNRHKGYEIIDFR